MCRYLTAEVMMTKARLQTKVIALVFVSFLVTGYLMVYHSNKLAKICAIILCRHSLQVCS